MFKTLVVSIATLLLAFSAESQEVVSSSKIFAGNNVAQVVLPEGCYITGTAGVTAGNTYIYSLNCVDGSLATSWQVTCGVITDQAEGYATIKWNSSGCTSGTVKAMSGSAVITSKTVTISQTPPPAIVYTPLYTSTNFTKTIDLSRPVGTIAGTAGTTPSGGVIYSIPIYAPPATNGVKPSVSINYNSQAAAGVAGWGWGVTGLSVISRTGKNIYHNGIVQPVKYTAEDGFLLDGMRFNAITGSNGSNGTIYAGETETFAKIVSNTSESANNPDWFKVTAKDGSIMEFGHTEDSRILTDNGVNVMLWRLNRVLDINGNYTDFVYDNSNRDSRIKTIKYAGNINTGLAPYNILNFTYKLRKDKNTGYDAGGSLSSQYLLDKIAVFTDVDIPTKYYQFNYGFDNLSSFLKEVVESGGDNTKLNSTIFLYGEKPEDVSSFQSALLTGNYDVIPGDFDGDGLSDVLAAPFVYQNGIKKHTNYSIFSEFNSGGSATELYSHTLPATSMLGWTHNNLYNFLAADYNGDGRDDVLYFSGVLDDPDNDNNYQTFLLDKIVVNTTGSFNSQTGSTDYTTHSYDYPVSQGYHYLYTNTAEKFFLPGDFDGDGNQDYLLFLQTRPMNQYKAFFSSPATNELNLEIGTFGVGSNPYGNSYAKTVSEADNILPVDFDGDGKMELLVIKNNTSYILNLQRVSAATGFKIIASVIYTTTAITKNCTAYPGDMNGDHKTDLLMHYPNNTWGILYSTGTSFTAAPFSFQQQVAVTGYSVTDKVTVADFNGDGKSDIMHGYNNTSTTSKLSLYYSVGQSSSTPFYYEQYSHNTIMSPEGVDLIAGDFNGDGRSDIVSRFSSMAEFIKIKPLGKERLMAKVTDGHNTTTSFDYKLLTDKSTYPYFYDRTISLDDAANKNPYNYVQLPFYAVSSLKVPDGIGGNNTTTFSYEDAVVHRAAKGFLGFKKITAKNSVTGITSTTENKINTQFAVLYTAKQISLLTSTSAVLSESFLTNSFTNLSTGSNDKRFIQKLYKALSMDYVNGAGNESVNTYDSYGNITTNVTRKGSFSGTEVTAKETTTTTASFGIHNTPVAAKPNEITVSNVRDALAAKGSTTKFTYTAAGLVASKVIFAGLAKAVTTTNTYNSFGNLTQSVTSATGVGSRTLKYTYDNRGIFATKKEVFGTGVSQAESYSYDYEWGNLLRQTSSDCLVTTFEYDAFGRLKKTNLPEGYAVNTSMNWDVQGQNIFYTLTDYPGGNPDTKVWYDKLGRQTKKQTAGFNNQWLTRVATYDVKGNIKTQTNDYYAAETPLTTTNTYDVYNRLTKSANTLSTITYAYSKVSGDKMQVVTTNSAGQSSTKIADATGKIVTAIDKGGQLNISFDSWGNQASVKHGTIALVANTYDAYSRPLTVVDANAGTITYDYDPLGQLKEQTDAKGKIYNMTYDDLGRIITRQGSEGSTTYEYYLSGSCSNNNLSKVTGFNGVVKEYTYDTYKRPATEKITIDGIAYTTSFTYNQYNALTKTVYPSGIEENNTYDANGGLLTVTGGNAGSPVTLFTATSVNGFGQYIGFTLGNDKASQHSYKYGIPTRYYTAGIQDLNLAFDYTKGNLLTRRDAIKNITEDFTFDNLNRLTSAKVNTVQQFAVSYDGNTTTSLGNIVAKTDAGNYVYKTDKINAVAYITNPAGAQTPPANISTIDQLVTYTAFLKTASIEEDPYRIDFTYGPDYERVKTILQNDGAVQETRRYVGNYEKQIIAGGATREIHYINGGNGLCAILIKEAGVVTPYYVYTDHLGSLLTVTNAAGTVIAEQNFDAWGRKRNPANWQYTSVPTPPSWLYRGYTSHEHLPQFALINMNGRMYDPIQGRMLSPDNYVADPLNTQGYNRYSYAMNNPLTITDPDGEFFHIIVGALIGGLVNFGIKAAQGRIGSLSDGLKAFVVGAAAGALGAATGGASLAATGLAGASVAGGALAGVTSSIIASPILGIGNNVFFGDPYSPKAFLRDVIIGGIGGAVVGGAIAGFKGNNIWSGNPANGNSIWSFNNKPRATVSVGPSEYAGWENADGTFTDEFAGHKIGGTQATNGGMQYSDDLVKSAQQLYPKKAGITELHHIAPKYLGGAKNGALVPLNGAYHQVITNEFRSLYQYGLPKAGNAQMLDIMKQVYSKYPLPPGY